MLRLRRNLARGREGLLVGAESNSTTIVCLRYADNLSAVFFT